MVSSCPEAHAPQGLVVLQYSVDLGLGHRLAEAGLKEVEVAACWLAGCVARTSSRSRVRRAARAAQRGAAEAISASEISSVMLRASTSSAMMSPVWIAEGERPADVSFRRHVQDAGAVAGAGHARSIAAPYRARPASRAWSGSATCPTRACRARLADPRCAARARYRP